MNFFKIYICNLLIYQTKWLPTSTTARGLHTYFDRICERKRFYWIFFFNIWNFKTSNSEILCEDAACCCASFCADWLASKATSSSRNWCLCHPAKLNRKRRCENSRRRRDYCRWRCFYWLPLANQSKWRADCLLAQSTRRDQSWAKIDYQTCACISSRWAMRRCLRYESPFARRRQAAATKEPPLDPIPCNGVGCSPLVPLPNDCKMWSETRPGAGVSR